MQAPVATVKQEPREFEKYPYLKDLEANVGNFRDSLKEDSKHAFWLVRLYGEDCRRELLDGIAEAIPVYVREGKTEDILALRTLTSDWGLREKSVDRMVMEALTKEITDATSKIEADPKYHKSDDLKKLLNAVSKVLQDVNPPEERRTASNFKPAVRELFITAATGKDTGGIIRASDITKACGINPAEYSLWALQATFLRR